MTVSTDLILTDRIQRPITKKLTFPTKVGATRNNYTAAYCPGLVKFMETYSLSMKQLLLSEKDDLVAILETQGTGFVISWTPPTETSARLFYPPDKYKIERKTRLRGGVSEEVYDVSFELKNYY